MTRNSAFGPGAQSSDPRRGGGNVAGPGGPKDRHSMVVDPTNAVLMDSVDVVLIETTSGGRPQGPALALTLAGRINKTTERSKVMYLFDADGSAAIITELLALASRMGEAAFDELQMHIDRRMDVLRQDGAL